MVEGPVTGRRIKRRTVRTIVLGLTAFILVLAVIFGMSSFLKSSAEKSRLDAEARLKSITSNLISQISPGITSIQKQLAEIAQQDSVIAAFEQADADKLKGLQTEHLKEFKDALNLRFFLPGKYDVDSDSKPTIGFASLELLKKAEKKVGPVPTETHKPGKDEEHVVFIEAVVTGENKLLGLIHLSMPKSVYVEAVNKIDLGKNTYVSLQQGTGKKAITLTDKGDAKLKQGEPTKVKINGTRWSLAYWDSEYSTDAGTSQGFPFMTVLVVLFALLAAVGGWFAFMKLKKLKEEGDKDEGIVYQGAVKAIMEGAHPGMEALVPNLPDLGQARKINPVSEGMAGDDVTRISMPNEGVPAASTSEQESAPATETTKEQNTVDIDASIFRAYDIRGIVDKGLTKETVKLIGQAIGSEAKARNQTALVVGRDGRTHGAELSESLTSGILASGLDVTDVGMVPTPVLYFATHHLELQSGVMLTGSHNPPEYNGMKIVLGGETLSGEAITALRDRIINNDLSSGNGKLQSQEVAADYVRRISDDIPLSLSNSFKIVVDAGNGIAGAVAPQLYRALGHDVIELYCEVDGKFPNHHPDPSQPENMQALIDRVKSEDADLGFAFDGDGDRLGVVDKNGNIIWPDRQLMLLAKDVLSRNAGAPIIFDVKCSRYLKTIIESCGGKALMWKTGHSLIKSKMKEVDSPLAGEMSGHIFFKERWYGFDDALYTGARMLEIFCNSDSSPTEVFEMIPEGISTPELRVKLDEDEHVGFMEELHENGKFTDAEINDIDGIRADYSDGWGLVRPSNTSPNLVLRFEAESQAALERIQNEFREQMLNVKSGMDIPF